MHTPSGLGLRRRTCCALGELLLVVYAIIPALHQVNGWLDLSVRLRHAVAREPEAPLFFNGTFNASLDGTYNDLR